MRLAPRSPLGLAVVILIAGCGDNRGAPSSGDQADAATGEADAMADAAGAEVGWERFSDGALIKLRARPGGGALGLAAQPHGLGHPVLPVRTLLAIDDAGHRRPLFQPGDDQTLLDFAVHPSGELTALLADGDAGFRLLRLSRDGAVLDDTPVHDDALDDDPYYPGAAIPFAATMPPAAATATAPRPRAQFPAQTHDTARLATDGDDVVLVARAGGNAIIARGLAHRDGHYQPRWRTLVEPARDVITWELQSGSCDVFDQLRDELMVFVDADADGNVYVASSAGLGSTERRAHKWQFGESAHRSARTGATGATLTRIDADGRRAYSTYIAATFIPNLFGVRVQGDAVYVVGRERLTLPVSSTEPEAAGYGWNGYLAKVDRRSGEVAYDLTIDVDRGDALFDVSTLPDGRVAVTGATGYWQNTGGAFSIDEAPASLLIALDEATGTWRRIPVARGPRLNQGRALLVTAGRLFLGGGVDGPGTHSADGDPTRLRTDGTLAAVPLEQTRSW